MFACATLDKVQVFDLHVDKHTKLAEQKPVKQPRLTNLSFNQRDPIILVGDNHGGVTLLKLSPNLTKCSPLMWILAGVSAAQFPDQKIPKEFEGVSLHDYERNKMETLLQVVSKWEREEAWWFIQRYIYLIWIIYINMGCQQTREGAKHQEEPQEVYNIDDYRVTNKWVGLGSASPA